MNITVNGQARQAPASQSVRQLMEALRLETSQVAVELNMAIVPRSQYAETLLSEGDRVEIVRFIGGG